MSKKVWINLPLLLLVGCWEFAGERGQVGFTSGHTADGRTPWTPQTPVVRDAPLVLEAQERLDGAKTEWTDLQARARGGSLTPVAPGRWAVVPTRGTTRVRFGGEVRDRLTVRSKPASGVELGWDHPGEGELLVVADSWSPVGVWVVDGAGEPLGYGVDQLEVRCTAPLQCKLDDGLLVRLPKPTQQGTLTVGLAGVEQVLSVRAVAPEAVEQLELYSIGLPQSGLAPEGGRVWSALGRDASGAPIGGVTPQWLSHPDQHDPLLLALPSETVTARFQALQTQARPPGSPAAGSATPSR